MDSFDTMKDYLKKEMSKSEIDKASREARKVIAKVQSASGNSMRDKAINAGISYEDYMKAQRVITKKVS